MPYYPHWSPVDAEYHYGPQYYTPYSNSTATTFTVPYYTPITPITTASSTWQYTYDWTYDRHWPVSQSYQNEVWQQWVQPVSMGQLNVLPDPDPARQLQHDTARTRARILLAEFLSDEQKGELERHGRFHVIGSKGRRYCIRASGQSGNVDLLHPDGSVQATLCAHPGSYVPDGDAWLMQMIELRHDEDHFLQTANVHRGSLAGVA